MAATPGPWQNHISISPSELASPSAGWEFSDDQPVAKVRPRPSTFNSDEQMINFMDRTTVFKLDGQASKAIMTRAEITIRKAGPGDSAIILHHRRSMFRDMGEGTDKELDRMVVAAGPWLARALADGSYRHWLALDASGRVAGGGGVLLCPWPASPKDPCTERAVILNVYTEPEFRKQGIARQIMLTILGWIKQQGFRAVNLHASKEGRRLYEELGFEATNEMRLKFQIS
jgi:GNAT superfamily N-acetyltransferase